MDQGRNRIREVWKHNLREEFMKIIDVIQRYPFVAMVCSCL
jgi:hypothetical protein